MMQNAYHHLLDKIDGFTRRYYLNKVMKGTLLFSAALVSIYLLLSVTEFTFYFPSWLKWILVSAFGAGALAGLFFQVLKPLFSYFKLGKQISQEEAARIIGQHFPEVEDKLLNILQLKSESAIGGSRELIEASISQKSKAIEWVPFSKAIDLGANKKYLRYTLPPFAIVLILLLFSPDILKESNARLAQPGKNFSKPAPFQFKILNSTMKVVQFRDYVLEVKMTGEAIPEEVEVIRGNERWKMVKDEKGIFTHRFLNVQESFSFRMLAAGFYSDDFELKVLKKPGVAAMKVSLQYPAYTGKKAEVIHNAGDFVVPEGTSIQWELTGDHTDIIHLQWDNEPAQSLQPEGKVFRFGKKIMLDTRYKIITGNQDISAGDSVLFGINIIPDRNPAIAVEDVKDSTQPQMQYFMGNVSDDYGFSRLEFHTRIYTEKNAVRSSLKQKIPLQKGVSQDFTFQYNVGAVELAPGERLEYFFEIWDNDGVHGPKAARSNIFNYSKPTVDEFRKMESSNNSDIKQSLSKAAKDVQKMSSEIKNLRDKILTKKNLTWEDKKQAEDLMKKNEALTQQLEETKQKLDETLKNQEEFKQVDEELLQKQELLQQMMDEMLSQEMKDLMKELEQLLEKFQQNNAFDKLENMQMSNENLRREMDKMLELFKRMELEQKAKDVIQQLENLAQKQDELQQQSGQNQKNGEQLSQKQDDLNKEFEKIKESISELQELNKDQEKPMELNDMPQEQKDIEQNMNDAKEQLQQNQKNGAQKKQQQAKDQMKQMAQKLQKQMEEQQMEQSEEDINAIRRLLENLVKLSMDQENLMKEVKKTRVESPRYVALVQEQYKIKDDARMIEDSLTALGKRVFQLQTFISDEVYKMKRDIKDAIDLLEDRQKEKGASKQQYVMTSANDLAVMLSEAMDQMQMQMNNSKSGSGQCKKPGGSSSQPSPEQLKKMQEQLGKDLQKTGEELKNGQGGSNMSKQLAEMAERQAAIRAALRQLRDKMSQQQKKESGIDGVMDQMDKIERDIVNKQITPETLKRQKEIENKMLELENAVREQDEDDKRKSDTAKDTPSITPSQLTEFLRKKKAALDQLQNVPPELKPFYKNLVDKYFDNVSP